MTQKNGSTHMRCTAWVKRAGGARDGQCRKRALFEIAGGPKYMNTYACGWHLHLWTDLGFKSRGLMTP